MSLSYNQINQYRVKIANEMVKIELKQVSLIYNNNGNGRATFVSSSLDGQSLIIWHFDLISAIIFYPSNFHK